MHGTRNSTLNMWRQVMILSRRGCPTQCGMLATIPDCYHQDPLATHPGHYGNQKRLQILFSVLWRKTPWPETTVLNHISLVEWCGSQRYENWFFQVQKYLSYHNALWCSKVPQYINRYTDKAHLIATAAVVMLCLIMIIKQWIYTMFLHTRWHI